MGGNWIQADDDGWVVYRDAEKVGHAVTVEEALLLRDAPTIIASLRAACGAIVQEIDDNQVYYGSLQGHREQLAAAIGGAVAGKRVIGGKGDEQGLQENAV